MTLTSHVHLTATVPPLPLCLHSSSPFSTNTAYFQYVQTCRCTNRKVTWRNGGAAPFQPPAVCPCTSASRAHCTGSLVGPRDDLHILEKRKVCCPNWEINHNSSADQPAGWVQQTSQLSIRLLTDMTNTADNEFWVRTVRETSPCLTANSRTGNCSQWHTVGRTLLVSQQSPC